MPHPADRRSYLLELTERGELAARAADPVLEQAYAALRRQLPRPLEEYEQAFDELNAALADAVGTAPAGDPLASSGTRILGT